MAQDVEEDASLDIADLEADELEPIVEDSRHSPAVSWSKSGSVESTHVVASRDRSDTLAISRACRNAAGPVVLATLSVRVDPAAEEMAIASALEAGVPLTVANAVLLPPYPLTIMLLGAQAATLPHEEDLDAVRGTARRAAILGIATRHLRISTFRPVSALLEVAGEQNAGLFVFGPDPRRLGRRRFRRAARYVREHAGSLTWVASED